MNHVAYETASKSFFVLRDGRGKYSVLKNEPSSAVVIKTHVNQRNQAAAYEAAVQHADRLEEIKHGSGGRDRLEAVQ
ncbi:MULTISPECIES: hypothetical protein [unclassified Acidocella]|uniref:hypothetical protein n=1 Tax=unclassified Acidocella TaxID=2648610 RepID=UPI00028CD565|nr:MULTISPECIES: hypothetical protein [unclassified Acidocella]EKN01096.1 hypothetical protein MXAZACID_02284 [Acidocella sp. MX-AZ02]WBO60574.1 hypothetical protein GT370_07325 [Acidocella sp. MX-AZ03]